MNKTPYNQSWIGRELSITSSSDIGIVGRNGLVLDETKETITILEGGREVTFGKNSIEFKIGDSDVTIDGKLVRQRSEDRIYRNKRSE